MFNFLKKLSQPNNELIEALKKNPILIDVRSVAEFQSGSAAGATNIPVNILSTRLQEIPKDATVVVFCQSGGRSAVAAKTLQANGYTHVINGGGVASVKSAQASL
jgi:phage shock protein E